VKRIEPYYVFMIHGLQYFRFLRKSPQFRPAHSWFFDHLSCMEGTFTAYYLFATWS
jgi:hypothetical protein